MRLLILAAAGVLAGHRLAYWTAPHTHEAGVAAHHGHDYLAYLAAVLVPLAAVVLARVAWLEHRHRQRLVSFRALVALQVGLFLVQELVERAALGVNVADLFLERVLWVGVGAQLLVAGFVLGMARATPQAIPRVLGLASRASAGHLPGAPFRFGPPLRQTRSLLPRHASRSSRLVSLTSTHPGVQDTPSIRENP